MLLIPHLASHVLVLGLCSFPDLSFGEHIYSLMKPATALVASFSSGSDLVFQLLPFISPTA